MASECKFCGNSPTIKAHLIPQAFVKEIRDASTSIALTKGMTKDFRPTQNGLHDPDLLCSACDNQLGMHEKYAFEAAKKLRVATDSTGGSELTLEGFSWTSFLRFSAGLSWKYSATREHFGRIDVGPYQHVLLSSALGGAIDDRLDALIIMLKAKDAASYFFRAPKPDRVDGVNMIRFSVGMMLVMVKVDSRQPPRAQRPHWIRGKQLTKIPILPLDQFEEGKHLAAMWQDTSYLRFVDRSKR